MAIAWANVSLGEAAVSNQADKIANDLFVNIKDLDRKEQELLKDWIYEGVHAGKENRFSIIMCLYPKLIPNKRYLPTKKNGGVPPVCPDERLLS